MGHEAHLDHPGEVSWYVGHGPAPTGGPCPHTECGHHGWRTVAWGPDLDHYELVVCGTTSDDRPGRCNGRCRGWVRQTEGSNATGELWGLRVFDPDLEHRTTREERALEEARRDAERDARRLAAVAARAGAR